MAVLGQQRKQDLEAALTKLKEATERAIEKASAQNVPDWMKQRTIEGIMTSYEREMEKMTKRSES